jgi:hypothetical protein
MSEPDHFSTVLDVEAHEQLHDHSGDGGEHAGADGYGDFHEDEPKAPRKKSIPTPVLIIGGMVVFIAIGAGYQHFFGARPQSEVMTAPPASTSAEAGGMIASNSEPETASLPSPARSGGLVNGAASPPPLPVDMRAAASEPAGPVPSVESTRIGSQPMAPAQIAPTQIAAAQAPVDMGATTGSLNATGAPMTGNTAAAPADVSTTAAPETASSMIPATAAGASVAVAPAVTVDPKDAEIAQLKSELKEAKAHHGATPKHALKRVARVRHAVPASEAATAATAGDPANAAGAASDAATADAASGSAVTKVASNSRHARHGVRGKHAALGILAGYRVKQVVPGQGWVEDEQTGKQQVVSVGDKIGDAQVTKIDPDTYRIVTTAGVIQ